VGRRKRGRSASRFKATTGPSARWRVSTATPARRRLAC
jgi:hypothetical protein